jgi:hypothetical protein
VGGDLYVSSSADDSGGTILTSPDGAVWTKQSSGIVQDLQNIAWGNNQFVVVSYPGYFSTDILSTDGLAWTTENSGTSESLRSIAWGNNRFVAAGDDGTILTSSSTSALHYQTHSTRNTQQKFKITGICASYTVRSAGMVTLQLYDSQGRMLKTLVHTKQEAGTHTVALPAGVPQGCYILSYKTGDNDGELSMQVTTIR